MVLLCSVRGGEGTAQVVHQDRIIEVSTEGVVYIPQEEYLIVGFLEYGGKLITRSSGRASVFHIINKRLNLDPIPKILRRTLRDKDAVAFSSLCGDAGF